MTKPKVVHYHQHGRNPLELHIVETNADGSLDLAREKGGKAIITGIKLSDEPGDGKCTLVASKKAKPAGKDDSAEAGAGAGEGPATEGEGGGD